MNLIRQRLRAQLLDVPNHLSSHTVPTPRGSGLGFLLAFGVALPLRWIGIAQPSVALASLTR